MRNFQVGDELEFIGDGIMSQIYFNDKRDQCKIYTIESINSYDEKNDYINLVEIPGVSFHISRFKVAKSQIREEKLNELLKWEILR